ncbi:MAG: MFS transporter, partial [Trebonia sp.]
QLQWVVDAYSLAFAVLLLSAGAVADRYGRKRLFQAGMAVFTLGSLLCGLSGSSAELDAARTFQGIGGHRVDNPVQFLQDASTTVRSRRAYERSRGH